MFMPKLRLIGGINKHKPYVWTIDDYYSKRNTILIQRGTGGLGDIFMHRMIFEDFKLLCPEIKIVFSCPKVFHQAVQDHPFIDEIVDIDINPNHYVAKYDTTTICGTTEMTNAPKPSPHRSDIWAGTCGITLTKHNMHFRISDSEKELARKQIKEINEDNLPTVVLCPNSAISSKNLDEFQCNDIIKGLNKLGYFVFGLHHLPIINFSAPQLSGRNIRNFMAIINEADYVITVDSAAFHMAGGLNKPQVGIFSWADGDTYGKYYTSCKIVQRHRKNGNWDCGPCYNWGTCPKEKKATRKPCITEITGQEVIDAFLQLL